VIPRSSRLLLWSVALLLSLSLYVKGRAPTGKGEGAAFLRAGKGELKVRLAGDFPQPGLYLFPDGSSLATAIKMTVPALALPPSGGGGTGGSLRSGDVVTLTLMKGRSPEFTVGRMGVPERMLLKIPLDPDLLTAAEWDLLPGIGPALSARIVADRQKNGAFGSLQGVLRVPGVGPGRMAALKPYF